MPNLNDFETWLTENADARVSEVMADVIAQMAAHATQLTEAERERDALLARLQAAEARAKKWEAVFGHLGEPDAVGNEWHALSDKLKEAENTLEEAQQRATWFERRCNRLQALQPTMRDPERTIVCDVLANGDVLAPSVAGSRYAVPRVPGATESIPATLRPDST